MIKTSVGVAVDNVLLQNYFQNLVNSFFKILPIRENEEETLSLYIQSLQIELLGCKSIILALNHDPQYLTLISILQYFIDNPDCEVCQVKREVFRAISICNKLKAKYAV